MTELWNLLAAIFRDSPVWLNALLFAWAFSWGVTQALKFFVPVRLNVDERKELAQLLAFVSAALVVVIMKPLDWPLTILLAALAGFWSPISFALFMAVLRRFWPWAADVLSQDQRGVLFGNREDPKP